MTRHDTLTCVHEPFGDAFYYGPERLSERYEKDEKERIESGFADSTYKTILDRIERDGSEVRSFPPGVTVLADEPSTFPFLIIHFAQLRYTLEHLYIFTKTQTFCYLASLFVFAAIFKFPPSVFNNPASGPYDCLTESNKTTDSTTHPRALAKQQYRVRV